MVESLIYNACNILYDKYPEFSAKKLFHSKKAKYITFFCFLLLILGIIFSFELFFKIIFYIANILFFGNNIFKLVLFFIGTKHQPKDYIIKEKHYPYYSIIIPLYKEKGSVINLINAIKKFDYPKEKIEIKFAIEEDDQDTAKILISFDLPDNFKVIKVPYSMPRTKAKACNYALNFIKGEYFTIYDAEDIPGPDQLNKVINKFIENINIACVQARLNYYNRFENILTYMFSIEYSLWFNYMLIGLKKLKMPIPLGGTSCHFKTEVVKTIGGLDPFNVTEDADLGIRLSYFGFETEIISEVTLEEAPISIWQWLKQRTRWIKGYMQTYFVYMRHPILFYKNMKFSGFLGTQLFIGLPTFSFLITPIILFMLIYVRIEKLDIINIDIAIINFIYSFLLHLYISLYIVKTNKWHNKKYIIFIFPFYYFLHILGAIRALYQLITNPHYWDKTEHGMSKYVKHF